MVLNDLTATDATALLRGHIGARVKLVQDYMTNKGGSEWLIKSVNMLGGTCVIAVTPTEGAGKGFFAPYRQFELLVDDAAPEPTPPPKVEETAPFDPLCRGEFGVHDFDSDTPVYELFYNAAPDSDSARELFMTYVMDHSEFDTEFLEDVMRRAGVRAGVHWSDTNVTQMLMLLNETRQPEDPPVVVPPAPEPPAPAPKPHVSIHADVKPFVVSDISGPDPEAPKRRGRPPGSKNKATEQPAMRLVNDIDLASALDNLPPGHAVVEPDHVILDVPEPVEFPKTLAVSELHPLAFKLAGEVLQHVGPGVNTPQVIEHMLILLRRALNL